MPSAHLLALDTVYFDECLPLTLGKECLHFFSFFYQTFYGVLLHYVDLHVTFLAQLSKYLL
jgi:hypothetical protein